MVALIVCVSVNPVFAVMVEGHGWGDSAAALAVFGTRIGTVVMPVFGQATEVLETLTASVTEP